MDTIIWLIGIGLPVAMLIFAGGWLVGFNASEDMTNWGTGWDSGWERGWDSGFDSGYMCGIQDRRKDREKLKEKESEEA